MAGLPCRVSVLGKDNQAEAKLHYVQELGLERTVCIGNGRNDRLMLKAAALGLAVVLAEGIAGETIQAADIVSRSINDALDLLLNPLRLTATLRS
jgi:soluble P-type ATPase